MAVERPSDIQEAAAEENRSQRRKKHVLQKDADISRRMHFVSHILDDTSKKWSQTLTENGSDFSNIIYNSQPIVHSFLSASKEMGELTRSAFYRRFEFKEGTLQHYLDRDLFSVPVNGTTLAAIEKMDYPLDEDEINTINKMFRKLRFAKKSPVQNTIRHAMVILAAQDIARPDQKIAVPKNLVNLKDRLTDYFDYYTDLMTNFSLDDKTEIKFINAIADARAWLMPALGNYIPARLGITPASAIKIYGQHFDYLPGVAFFIKKMWLEEHSKNAISNNALPPDLMPFALYSPEADKKAAALLVKSYEAQDKTNEEQIDVWNQSNSLIDRLGIYQKALNTDIVQSKDKRTEFEFGQNSAIEKITLCSQNRSTLIFITHFRGNNTYLTFEIDRFGNTFGFPPKLINNNPQVVDALLADTLKIVLDKAKSLHPSLEKEKFTPPLRDISEQTQKPSREMYVPTPKEKTVKTPQSINVDLPVRQEENRRKFIVLHSRGKITTLMGKNPREKDVDRMMKNIRNWEFGLIGSKTIDWSEGHVQSIRVGKYRIILEHLRDNFYTVDAVGHRNNSVYRDYADSKGI